MRVKNKPWAQDLIKEYPQFVLNVEKLLTNIYNNFNPIHLEIGMGKGDFILEKAYKFPKINFLGVEISQTIIAIALKKFLQKDLINVRLINVDANKLAEALPPNSLACIYLNFSDPWPKKRHHKRRLTSPSFLEVYEKILIKEGQIIIKTDNLPLFEYSLEQFKERKYKIIAVDYNYDVSQSVDDCMTEYEHKFKERGIAINRAIAIVNN